MTCKDCYHNDACGLYGADDCDLFKDKSTIAEVVRCKDCKYWKEGPKITVNCSNFYGLSFPSPNDFCSYAEVGGETNGGE